MLYMRLFNMRMQDEEYAGLSDRATAAGMTMAAFVRAALAAFRAKPLTEPSKAEARERNISTPGPVHRHSAKYFRGPIAVCECDCLRGTDGKWRQP